MPSTESVRRRLVGLSPPQRWGGAIALLLLLALAMRGLLGGSADRRPPAGDAASEEARTEAGEDGEEGGEPHDPAAESTVVLDSVGVAAAGIRLATAVPAGAGTHVASGTITYDLDRVSLVAPRADARVVRVLADLGTAVDAGGALALLESTEVGSLRAGLAGARADVEVTREAAERERALFEQQVSSRREMLEAEGAYKRALAELRSGESELRALAAEPAGEGPAFRLRTPIGGTVVVRRATPGQVVGPADTLFIVARLDTLWVDLDLYEKDLGRVEAGQRLVLSSTALPDSTYEGEVLHVGQVVDPRTRTVKVRAQVANGDGRLRPGMFVTARIRDLSEPAATAVAVPEAAVQTLGERTVVFVPVGRHRFRALPVGVGESQADGTIVVTTGLRPGQRLVGEGSFYLKSELEKESFGGDSH